MYQISLNKDDKTLSLKRIEQSVRLIQTVKNISLKQTGRVGPQGEPGLVQSIVAGSNVSVDSTDPSSPIISSTGGSGAVDSVNTQTGVVVLDADDISDAATTNKYITPAQSSAITANTAKTGITPTQASDITTNNAKVGITPGQASDITANNAKVGITGTQASDITSNNAKITYPSSASTKLATIETNADVTDAANVAAAGAVIPTGTPDGTKFLRDDDVWTAIPASGDVVGPASSTDNVLPVYDGTTGKLLKNSNFIVDTAANSIRMARIRAMDGNSSKYIDTSGSFFEYSTFGTHSFKLYDGATYRNYLVIDRLTGVAIADDLAVGGDIAVTGTVDSRDVATDGTRLDVITDASYLNSNTTKANVGLGNVDNTTDVGKPVSTAQQTALNLKANDNAVVHLTGAESIDGVKTFSSSPIVPAPTTNLQAATKKYVDDNAGGSDTLNASVSKQIGQLYGRPVGAGTITTSCSSGVCAWLVWTAPWACTIDRIYFEVTTAGAGGAVARISHYAADADNLPTGSAVASGTTEPAIDSLGIKFVDLAVAKVLAKGEKIAFCLQASANTTFRSFTTAGMGGLSTSSLTGNSSMRQTAAYASGAPTAAAVVDTANNNIMILPRVSA